MFNGPNEVTPATCKRPGVVARPIKEADMNHDTHRPGSTEQARQERRERAIAEISRRREILSFSHHREVAALEPAEQDRRLEEALGGGRR